MCRVAAAHETVKKPPALPASFGISFNMAGSNAYQLSGLGHQAVEVDPSAPGTVIRGALIFESLANIPFTIAYFAYLRDFSELFIINLLDITPILVSFL
jgi:hypothetical protein